MECGGPEVAIVECAVYCFILKVTRPLVLNRGLSEANQIKAIINKGRHHERTSIFESFTSKGGVKVQF